MKYFHSRAQPKTSHSHATIFARHEFCLTLRDKSCATKSCVKIHSHETICCTRRLRTTDRVKKSYRVNEPYGVGRSSGSFRYPSNFGVKTTTDCSMTIWDHLTRFTAGVKTSCTTLRVKYTRNTLFSLQHIVVMGK